MSNKSCIGVMCNEDCAACPFTPFVQNERLEKGYFVEHTVTSKYYDPTGKVTHSVTKKVKTLHFKKGIRKENT